MATLRAPLQGVWNVVRFNWHFYAGALVAGLALGALALAGPAGLRPCALVLLALVLLPVLGSLLATAYVYDFAGLYQFDWLPATLPPTARVLTISAGFDEVSAPLAARYGPGQVQAADFYDPARHTEASIRRARQAYPPFPNTMAISTTASLPLPDAGLHLIVAFLAAHEIRQDGERAAFFRELGRVLAPTGTLVVTEHLRDPANFLAYTLGFLHFHSRQTWLRTFRSAGLRVAHEMRTTPLITTFFLCRDDYAA